jgi:hypothetical protein
MLMSETDTSARDKRTRRLVVMLALLAALFYAGVIVVMGLRG